MRRAIPIETVRDYLEHQMAAIEPDYQFELSQAEHGADWPAIWTWRTWLYWLEKKALQRAGVVSRELTQDAVAPFWSSPTSISASAEGRRRRLDDNEVLRRLRKKRERERAELNRLEQPGNEAERREFVRKQSEALSGSVGDRGKRSARKNRCLRSRENRP